MGTYANLPKRHTYIQRGQMFYALCSPGVAEGAADVRRSQGQRKACPQCDRVKSSPATLARMKRTTQPGYESR